MPFSTITSYVRKNETISLHAEKLSHQMGIMRIILKIQGVAHIIDFNDAHHFDAFVTTHNIKVNEG